MDRIVEKTLLYDFYGELLNEHQKSVYEDVVFNDMSLSEAADAYGISRQGVHDMLKRCDRALEGFEEKLHMVAQFEEMKKTVQEMQAVLKSSGTITKSGRDELFSMTEKLINELELGE